MSFNISRNIPRGHAKRWPEGMEVITAVAPTSTRHEGPIKMYNVTNNTFNNFSAYWVSAKLFNFLFPKH